MLEGKLEKSGRSKKNDQEQYKKEIYFFKERINKIYDEDEKTRMLNYLAKYNL